MNNISEDLEKFEYYKSKNIPKDPFLKETSNPPDSDPHDHLLEHISLPKLSLKKTRKYTLKSINNPLIIH